MRCCCARCRCATAGARVRTLPEAVLGNVRAVLGVLAGAVALLLLLACVNVGNLLLLRLTARRHEIAVRRSLGAGAGDIVRGLLIEGGVLGAVGGAIGLALAAALIRALLIIAPAALPRTDLLRLAGAPWAAATGLVLVTALLISVLPALVAVRRDPGSPLRVDVRAGQAGAHRGLRQWFVASQVALALVVLAGAGLLVRSLERLQRIDLGYEPEHLALLQLATPVTPADADRQSTICWTGWPPPCAWFPASPR
jgi:putative ABC transport system permease protein